MCADRLAVPVGMMRYVSLDPAPFFICFRFFCVFNLVEECSKQRDGMLHNKILHSWSLLYMHMNFEIRKRTCTTFSQKTAMMTMFFHLGERSWPICSFHLLLLRRPVGFWMRRRYTGQTSSDLTCMINTPHLGRLCAFSHMPRDSARNVDAIQTPPTFAYMSYKLYHQAVPMGMTKHVSLGATLFLTWHLRVTL